MWPLEISVVIKITVVGGVTFPSQNADPMGFYKTFTVTKIN